MQIPLETSAKEDELRVPSPPPRRLSRSSIDLRDLEQQYEKVSHTDSAPSIIGYYFEKYLRNSDSEPLRIKSTPNHKQSNFFQPFFGKPNMMKQPFEYLSASLNGGVADKKRKIDHIRVFCPGDDSDDDNRNGKIKDLNYWKKISVEDNNYEYMKLQLGALSDSDFLALKNSSDKFRDEFNKIKRKNNVIYALSDSDFFISGSDKSKKQINNKNDVIKSILGFSKKKFEYSSLNKEQKRTRVLSDGCDNKRSKSYNTNINLDSPNLRKRSRMHSEGNESVSNTKNTPDILIGLFDVNQSKSSSNNGSIGDETFNKPSSDELINLNDDLKDDKILTCNNFSSLMDKTNHSLSDFGVIENNRQLDQQSGECDFQIPKISKSSDAVLCNEKNNIYDKLLVDLNDCNTTDVNFETVEEKITNLDNSFLLSSPISTPNQSSLNLNQNIHNSNFLSPLNQHMELFTLTPGGINNHQMFISDASTISLDIVVSPINKIHHQLKPEIVMDTASEQISPPPPQQHQHQTSQQNSCLLNTNQTVETNEENDVLSFDDKNKLKSPSALKKDEISGRKRQPSVVTYDVNVINFSQESNGGGGNYGAMGRRSTSSASEFNFYFFLNFFFYFMKKNSIFKYLFYCLQKCY